MASFGDLPETMASFLRSLEPPERAHSGIGTAYYYRDPFPEPRAGPARPVHVEPRRRSPRLHNPEDTPQAERGNRPRRVQ
jgi:hypothetical protein